MAITASSPRIISRPRDERDPNFGWFGFKRDGKHVFVRSPLTGGTAEARAMFAKCEPDHAEYAEVADGEALVIVGYD